MEYKNSQQELKPIKSLLLSISFNYSLNKSYFLIILMLFYFTSEQNEISLIVKGSDKRENFINDGFYLDPSEVIVNRDRRYSCQKSCYFEEGLNNVTIKFGEKINSCAKMFMEMTNIIEIDLSKLDTSGVTSMSEMFRNCNNVENIIFGNINTSSVTNMYHLFFFLSQINFN